MDNFTTLDQWLEDQHHKQNTNLFCGLWQWLVILASIALLSY